MSIEYSVDVAWHKYGWFQLQVSSAKVFLFDVIAETFSLDQMSDEEDIPTRQITASQLAVALAAAEGSMAASPELRIVSYYYLY